MVALIMNIVYIISTSLLKFYHVCEEFFRLDYRINSIILFRVLLLSYYKFF